MSIVSKVGIVVAIAQTGEMAIVTIASREVDHGPLLESKWTVRGWPAEAFSFLRIGDMVEAIGERKVAPTVGFGPVDASPVRYEAARFERRVA